MRRVLITCPPMLGMVDELSSLFEARNMVIDTPTVTQTLSEQELLELVPACDGWIAGDDPVNEPVLISGKSGRLKAVVKWGVGVDNVDFDTAGRLGIATAHTPGMFGADVADIAVSYLIGVARETFLIDREVRLGSWPKPRGLSLTGKTVGLVGYGDVGRHLAARLISMEMQIYAYDPALEKRQKLDPAVTIYRWPEKLDGCDFLVFCCPLTPETHHMLNEQTLRLCRPKVRVVNVARGGLINERALIEALQSGHVDSAALDVFDVEPLPGGSQLRKMDRCIFGSHNASNTYEGVRAASCRAIEEMARLLDVQRV